MGRRRVLAVALGLASVGLLVVAALAATRGDRRGAPALAPVPSPDVVRAARSPGTHRGVGSATASPRGRVAAVPLPAPAPAPATASEGSTGQVPGFLVAAGRVVDLDGAPVVRARLHVESEQSKDARGGAATGWRRLPSLATRCGPDGHFELVADTNLVSFDRADRDLATAPLRLVTQSADHCNGYTPFTLGAERVLVTLAPCGSVRVRPLARGDLPRGEVRLQLLCADGSLREAYVTLGSLHSFGDVPTGRASLTAFGLGAPEPLVVLDGLEVSRGERCRDVRLDPLVLDGLLERSHVAVQIGARRALPGDGVRVALAEDPWGELPGRWLPSEATPGGLELVVPRGSAPLVVFEARGCARSAPLELRPGLVVRLEPSRPLLLRIDAVLDPRREYAVELESRATPGWVRERMIRTEPDSHTASFADVPAGTARARLHEHEPGALDSGPRLCTGPWVECVVPEATFGALALRLEL